MAYVLFHGPYEGECTGGRQAHPARSGGAVVRLAVRLARDSGISCAVEIVIEISRDHARSDLLLGAPHTLQTAPTTHGGKWLATPTSADHHHSHHTVRIAGPGFHSGGYPGGSNYW